MIRVSVTDLKNRLSEYLRRVKQGEAVEILERSVPIARIEGIRRLEGGEDDVLAHLVAEGVLRRPRSSPERSIVDFEPIPCAADAVAVVIEQRGDR